MEEQQEKPNVTPGSMQAWYDLRSYIITVYLVLPLCSKTNDSLCVTRAG